MKNLLHYTACGLPNVWLENDYTKKETKYGIAVSVNDIDGLHKLLASKLIEKSGLLAGYEFRFYAFNLALHKKVSVNFWMSQKMRLACGSVRTLSPVCTTIWCG